MTDLFPFRKRYFPLWLLLRGVSLLPFPVLYLLSDVFYFLLYYLTGYRKKVVFQNLRNAFPEKTEPRIKAIGRAFYRNLADIIAETLKLGDLSPEDLKKRIRITNPEALTSYLDKGTTVLVMGSHACNWEWALPAASSYFAYPADGIYKPLHNQFFDNYMRQIRSKTGGNLIKSKDTLRDMVRRKNETRIISMLSDQTPPKGEIQYWTTFLNQDTGFYVGADKMAATFKLPVFFMGMRRLKRGNYEFTFVPVYDGSGPLSKTGFPVTEAYARHLETWIQQYPANYLWSHRRWKHKRPVTV
jgi:Kdo2-lipid IVA lauroyltransferase/acyltransferase